MRRIVLVAVLLLPLAVFGQQKRVKVACIGDSITYGSRLDDPGTQSYPAVMGDILGAGFEVRNFGISARCASDSSDYPYAREAYYDSVKVFSPDIITVMLGTNDSKPHNWNGEVYRQSLENIVKELMALPSRPRVILLTPVPAWDNGYAIRDSVIRHCVVPDVRWLSNRLGVEMVDMYGPFSDKAVFFPDGVHPDKDGAGLMAVIVAGACLQKGPERGGAYIPPVEEDVKENIAAWQDMKFGMFIHWGTYSIRGIVESWSLCPENVDWQFKSRPQNESYEDYVRGYEALQTQFNPVEFDPAKWAEAARYAGMKYVVFTTKHHDGFTMYDTAESDYKITSSKCPFSSNPRADIAKEIFDAFRAAGLKAGAYYSIADWHHQDYWWDYFPHKDRKINYDTAKFPEKWPRFQDFMVAQINELTCGAYGDLSMLWFDLCNPSNGSSAPVPWERMAAVARANQPGIMTVARHTHTIWENYCTPEQAIPEDILEYPWESCITMTNSWSWRPDAKYKTTGELLTLLVKIVARGGNFLLNVGPSSKGTLDSEAYVRLREIGDWMKVNGEGIYRSKPFALGGNVFGTTVDGAVYAFYVPESSSSDGLPSEIFIPNVSASSIKMLGAEKVRLKYVTADGGIKVTIPESLRRNLPCEHIWCIKITVD